MSGAVGVSHFRVYPVLVKTRVGSLGAACPLGQTCIAGACIATPYLDEAPMICSASPAPTDALVADAIGSDAIGSDAIGSDASGDDTSSPDGDVTPGPCEQGANLSP